MRLDSFFLHLKIPDSRTETIKDVPFSLTGERGQGVYTEKRCRLCLLDNDVHLLVVYFRYTRCPKHKTLPVYKKWLSLGWRKSFFFVCVCGGGFGIVENPTSQTGICYTPTLRVSSLFCIFRDLKQCASSSLSTTLQWIWDLWVLQLHLPMI